MLDWILNNKEWMFSGVGVVIVTATVGVLVRLRKKKAGLLKITDVGFTHESEFDVKLRNIGDYACVITIIDVSMIRDHHWSVNPILKPTARYMIPVDDLKKGESKRLNVSHVVDAHKADRILIALDTTTVYTLKVTFHYNENQTVSFKKKTW